MKLLVLIHYTCWDFKQAADWVGILCAAFYHEAQMVDFVQGLGITEKIQVMAVQLNCVLLLTAVV